MKRKITEKKSCFHVNSFCALKQIVVKTLLLFLPFMSIEGKAQITPYHYWTFDDATPLQDQMGRSNLNPTYYQCVYSINNASSNTVGKSLSLSAANSRVIVATNNMIPDSVISIEFMFKSAPEFNLTEFVRRRDNAILIRIGYPFIQFTTNVKVNGVATSDVQKIELEGIGRASYGYYNDGNWHHMVFKYNGQTGTKEIWVDGQLPAGFSKSVAKGKFDPNTAVPNNNIIDINSNTAYNKLSGSLDEIAFYKADLPSGEIYQHYSDSKAGQHYTFTNTGVSAPAPAPVTGVVDIREYAPGHPNYTVSPLEQLQTFPLPRYKPANTLTRNFNWIALDYFSGYQQPGISTSSAVGTSVNIQKELAGNWNYFLLVSSNTGNYTSYTDPTKFHGAWVRLANQNPQWPTSAISFWNQLNPTTAGYTSSVGYVESKSLPAAYYLRNSSGQYLSTTGAVSTTKYLSPAAPLDSFYNDANTQLKYFQSLVSSLTRPLDIISENGEVIPKLNTTAMSTDPYVTQDKNSTGLDWDTYQGNRKMRLAKLYSSKFLSLPQLANTYYSEYQISGHNTRHKYSETRYIQKAKNGQYYSTPDFYPRWPSNWQTGTGAWNGWQHIIDGRSVELNLGDNLFSPYVAAGWNGDEERNIRPAQWLGLMKALAGLGAEYYYTGYFNEANSYAAPNPPPNDPSGYAWQAVVPSYAQAITSRFEDFLRNGTVLPGDMPNNYSSPTSAGYSFYSGDLRKLVVIRKDNNSDRYAICSTIQPNSNYLGNAELEGDAKINLNGKALQFKVRRQGSTYIFDNSNPLSPVFYQLDGWHESSHPFYWSKDFNFEAELNDNAASNTKLITRVPAGTVAGDYRNYVTAVQVASSAMAMPVLEYHFTPRNQPAYYFWVKARSTDGASTGLKVGIDQQASQTISCITDTTWKWYSIESCNGTAISFTSLTSTDHILKLIPTAANIEIDAILLSTDMYLNLNASQVACGASIVNISYNGDLTVCNGKTVTLTAPSSASYSWSTGETTQSITVNTPGNFSVSVNQGGACNSISQSLAVTAISDPQTSISGNNSFCSGDSIQLSASGLYKFLWSDGSTTANINVIQGGIYQVTATDKWGCSATRNVSITENPLPVPVITAGSNDLTLTPSIKLTANGATAYVWQPGGSTGATLTVTTPGAYTVSATSAAGCTGTSQPFNVIKSSYVNIDDAAPANLCSGQTLLITATGATNYLWSPGGETTASIQVNAPGKYIVKAIDASGNVINSDSIQVQLFPTPMQPFISMTYIPESAYQLVASEPSAISYNWSTGATTQSATFTAATNVSVTATNAFGCTSAPVNIEVANPAISGCMIPDMLMFSEASDTSVVVQWNPAVQANKFILKYWKSGSSVINQIAVAGNVNQQRINGLSVNTSYNWTVESQCTAGNFVSLTSAFNTLNTSLTCGSRPMHLSTNNILTTSAKLNWYTTEADSFTVRYRVTGATAYNYLQLNGAAASKGTTLTGLTTATTYEWQVMSYCSGYASAYTSTVYFTTTSTCGYMGNVVVTQMRTNSVTLKWDNTTPMDSVKIQITNVVTGAKKIVKINYNPTNGTYRVNGLQANTKYYAEVRGMCGQNNWGAWSQPVYFTTPSANLREAATLKLNGYPNPTTTHLSYAFESESDTAYSVRVCDMSGRQLMQEVRQAQEGIATDEIQVSNYSKGVYLLIITQGTMTGYFRFSVQ